MAKTNLNILPLDTEIELISIKGDKVRKNVMKYGDALKLPKTKGVRYIYYQLGFSQFKN